MRKIFNRVIKSTENVILLGCVGVLAYSSVLVFFDYFDTKTCIEVMGGDKVINKVCYKLVVKGVVR